MKSNYIPIQKDFEYLLWKDEQGNCFTKIKSTGEVSQVDLKTFRYLRSLEKELFRNKAGNSVYDKKDGKSEEITLINNDEEYVQKLHSLIDPTHLENEVLIEITISDFKKQLTEKQLEIFVECMLKGVSTTDYADKQGVRQTNI